jgi:hypothetical protein
MAGYRSYDFTDEQMARLLSIVQRNAETTGDDKDNALAEIVAKHIANRTGPSHELPITYTVTLESTDIIYTHRALVSAGLKHKESEPSTYKLYAKIIDKLRKAGFVAGFGDWHF